MGLKLGLVFCPKKFDYKSHMGQADPGTGNEMTLYPWTI